MKTSKRKVVGIVLIIAAVIGALTIQSLGPGLISTQSLPIPESLPGMVKASSVRATYHHWPLMVLVALIGAVCYFFSHERQRGGNAG